MRWLRRLWARPGRNPPHRQAYRRGRVATAHCVWLSLYILCLLFGRNHGVPSCVHGPQCCVTLLLSASWSPSLSRRRARVTCVMSARDENVIDIRRVRYNYAIYIRVRSLSPSLPLCFAFAICFCFALRAHFRKRRLTLRLRRPHAEWDIDLAWVPNETRFVSAKWQRYHSAGN